MKNFALVLMFFVKIYLSFRFLTVHPSSYSGRGPKNYCIDELTDYLQLQNKKIVAIDPGKCDFIYCIDYDKKKQISFVIHNTNEE